MIILPDLIFISASGLISLTQSIADDALWSNWPGRYSIAIYFLFVKSSSSNTLSVTISPNTLYLAFSNNSESKLNKS